MKKSDETNTRAIKMASQLRLKDAEQEKIRKKAIEINKLLVREGWEPLKDSEIVHTIIDLGLDMAEVNRQGKIVLVEK
jgi:hypothetical protein